MSQAYLVSGGKSTSREEKLRELYQKEKPGSKLETDPDGHFLAGDSIKIENIRELEHLLALKPYGSPPKIALIRDAEKLTFEAQGALLKILEEPPGETIFILTTTDETNLLPTIVSRCQMIHLAPESELTLEIEEIRKIQQLLEKIFQSGAGERLKIAEEFATREEAILFCQKQLVFWREKLLADPSPKILKTIREIQKTLRYLSANVNPKLALENLLLSYPSSSK